MVQYHKHARTKSSGSGGLKRRNRDKVLSHYGGFFARPRLSETDKNEIKPFKVRGGKLKAAIRKIAFANIVVEGKSKRTRIKNVLENPADRHFVREKIITKGTIVETEAGKARITNRPGQDGVANAVLVK
ncbi:MAG: 30S ribosomal protein S8e [Candidatus Micrarchaeota archaeon]